MPEQYDIDSEAAIERREAGLQVLAGIDGEDARALIEGLAEVSPALAHHIAAWGFGEIYARPGLDPRSRQLVTLGILTALGTDPQLRVHINTSLNVGITREEITEVFLHSALYAGFPRVIRPHGRTVIDGVWGRILLTAISTMCWSTKQFSGTRTPALTHL